MQESQQLFESRLRQEVLRSERLRAAVLAGLFATASLLFPSLFLFFRDEFFRVFHSLEVMYYGMAFTVAVLSYELIVRFIIGRRLHKGLGVPEALRYVNAFVETSSPTVLMIIVGRQTNPYYTLLGPPEFIYFLFIVLSTLRMDAKLSVFTGAVAAAEYLSLAYFHTTFSAHEAPTAVMGSFVMYIGKGVVLLLAGVAAAFVTVQIKGRMLRVFQTMDERNKVVSLFGQQVSQPIVDELLKHKADMQGKTMRVCVMFLDIRNFTPYVEHRKPEEVVAYLNALFGFMIEIVTKRHGIINQFLGDGFMATFGAPVSVGNECENAVGAATEIVARLQEETRAGRIPPTTLGIGLHTGEAVTGNVGSAERKQYSITGNVVILASRIEQLTKQYEAQILFSEEVWKRIDHGKEEAVALGSVTVKGREAPVSLYSVRSQGA